MSTEQTRTSALTLAVDLTASETEVLGRRALTSTVLERARLFDAYIAGTASEGTELDLVAIDEAAAHAETEHRVTPADVYARGRMSQ